VIVLDASAAVELLLNTPLGERVGDRLASGHASLHAPQLLDVEVLHVLRRLWLGKVMSERRARQALADLAELPVTRYPHEDLIGRAWALRATLTAYDGMYVALAEALDATLVTCDGRLGRAHGHEVDVEVIGLAS
jgi:predicted nucleic acid-binding protein